MSLDIVDKCFDRQISHAIIVAGDSDFVPAIKMAKGHGAIIHLFHHCQSIHHHTLDVVDEIYEFDENFFEGLFLKE